MKFIDFFAGIGGISLGLERAGHECVGHCEIDPYACKVLKKHWPDVPLFGDIKEIDANEILEAELWCGGFPCQDISNAGKRAGIHGERSGLFFDFMRLATVVRPRRLLLENVGALINRGLSEVLGCLAKSGYGCEWNRVSASAVGALHRRERIFILAHNRGERIQRFFPKTVPEFASLSWCKDVRGIEDLRGGSDLPEPLFRGGRDGIPNWVDRLRCLGNAVVPQVAEYIGRLLTEPDTRGTGAVA